MNKGLEAIISLRNRLIEKGIKDQFLEELIAIEKELKALEIIKNKQVDTKMFMIDSCLEHYNMNYRCEELTQEEYNLLEEVLKWLR